MPSGAESLIGSHTKSVVDGFPVLIKFFHNSIIVSDTLESASFNPSSGIQLTNRGSKSM